MATGAGSAGTIVTRYALANHSHPRITNSQVVTTVAGGGFTVVYPVGFFAAPPVVDLSWVNTTASFMDCELTGDPTTLGCTGRCRAWSLTGLLALGAGIKVHILSLPAS